MSENEKDVEEEKDVEKKNNVEPGDFEGTNIFLNLSKSGKALTIKEKDGCLLSVAVSQVERLVKGDIKGLTFSRSKLELNGGAPNV